MKKYTKQPKEMTVREIKDNFTKEDIESIFKLNGLYIRTCNDKGDSRYGMTRCFSPTDRLWTFHSHVLAYHYFLEMNWI